MAQSGSLSAEIESLRQLMEAFRAFDGDNDGRISAAELGGIMSSVGYSLNDQDVGRMMQEWDRNRDGSLSQAEFIEMSAKNMGIADGLGGLLESALEVLEGEESVSGEVLYEAVCTAGLHPHLSMENCIEIIAALDGDEDGALTFQELQTIVNLFV